MKFYSPRALGLTGTQSPRALGLPGTRSPGHSVSRALGLRALGPWALGRNISSSTCSTLAVVIVFEFEGIVFPDTVFNYILPIKNPIFAKTAKNNDLK